MFDKVLSEYLNNSKSNFDESVDIAVNLSFDVKRYSSEVKGRCVLPCGLGRNTVVYAFIDSDIDAGLLDVDGVLTVDQIESFVAKKKIPFDVLITSPSCISKLAKKHVVTRFLGARGLMPNAKFGTLSVDLSVISAELKKGVSFLKADKGGIVHAAVGTKSLGVDSLVTNIEAVVSAIASMKPSDHKGGNFVKRVCVSSTMGIGSVEFPCSV